MRVGVSRHVFQPHGSSLAHHHVGAFLLVNTNFFDNFCQIETDALCKSSWETAELVMRLLDWRISTSEEKRLSFAHVFQILGAVVDLSETCWGQIFVKNKQSRLDDIKQLVQSILEKPKIPLSQN